MIIKALSLFLLIFFCVVGLASLHYVDKENMWNITETTLTHSYENASNSFKINPEAQGLKDIIINIVYKIADTIYYTTIQVTKIAGRLAIENPQINFRLILWLIMLVLILFIALPLIKVLAVIYVFIKDFRDERRYKKQMKELRR